MIPNGPSTGRNHQLADITNAIEAELRVLGLWEDQVPSQADMSSRMPFCYDTLRFWQWLQWVFIPRIRLILAEDSAWPTSSEIAPLAETEFRRLPQDCSRLLAMIRTFDLLITRP
jgi:uncharacterized protein YqcC (DUF446 family)